MGAVRMRVQTADKNINYLHDSSPSINILSEKLHVCKKQIHHLGVLTFKPSLQAKYIIHSTASSSEKEENLWKDKTEICFCSSHNKIYQHNCLE